MKTSPAAPARPSTTSGSRLWRLAAMGLVAPVVALAACSGGSTGAADATATGGSTATGTATSSSSTASAAPTTSATTADEGPVDQVLYLPINATITDPDLGHTITATRVSRRLPWPSGQPVSRKEFEIVGVQVTLKAGSRYSATLDPSMLSLVAASPAQTVMPTTEFGNRWSATPLSTADRSQTSSGWVFFKVDRGTGSSLTLVFNRPAYEVSTTGRSFPAKTFSAVLAK